MKLFSDLLKAHIPVYLSQFVSIFSVCLSTQMELNVTHGTLKTLKVHISALHYDHIR